MDFKNYNKLLSIIMGCAGSGSGLKRSQEDSQNDEVQYCDEKIIRNVALYEVKPNEMREQLHKHSGAVNFKVPNRPNQLGRGTGQLISPNLVLTCAHNIYYNSMYHVQIVYYHGPAGPHEKKYRVVGYYFPKKFKTHPTNPKYDYALMKLEQKVMTDDFIPICDDHKKIQAKNNSFAIFGYPGDKYSASKKTGEQSCSQWGRQEKVKGFLDKIDQAHFKIQHMISTLPGQSGASIILISDLNTLEIVGIHKGGVPDKELNGGRLITKQLIYELEKQTQKLGAEKFLKSSTPREKKEPESPKKKENILQQGQKQIKNKRPQLARQLFLKQIQLDNKNYQAYFGLGLALRSLKEYKDAVASFQKVLQLNQEFFEAHIELGKTFLEDNNIQMAWKSFQKTMELKPQDSIRLTEIALGFGKCNDPQSSIRVSKIALGLDSKSWNTHFILGTQLQNLKRYEQAIDSYQTAEYLKPQEEQLEKVLYNMGEAYNSLRKHDDAIKCYDRIIRMNTTHPVYYLKLGTLMSQKKDVQRSIHYYRQATRLNPDYSEALILLGIQYSKNKSYKECYDCLSKAIEITPDDPHIYFSMGNALYNDRKHKDSIQYYKRAIEKDTTNNMTYYFNQGLAYKQTQQSKYAILAFQKVIETEPVNINALKQLGRLYYDQQQFQQAISTYQQILSIQPQSLTAHFNLGVSYANIQKSKQALHCFLKVITIKPDYPNTYSNIGMVLNYVDDETDIKEAIDILNRILKENPNNSEVDKILKENRQRTSGK